MTNIHHSKSLSPAEPEKFLSRGYTKISDEDLHILKSLDGELILYYAKVFSLTLNPDKVCTANDQYFARWRYGNDLDEDQLTAAKRKVQRVFLKLERAGYIKRKGNGSIKRHIKALVPLKSFRQKDCVKNDVVNYDTFELNYVKNDAATTSKVTQNYVKNDGHRSILNNNETYNENKNPLSPDERIIQNTGSMETLHWFNECLKRYRLNEFAITEQRIKMTGDLLKSYDVSDIKKVINAKCREWYMDEKSRQWLDPHTLFKPINFKRYVDKLIDQSSTDVLPAMVPDRDYPF